MTAYHEHTRISDVSGDPVFGSYGRLIFPIDHRYYSGDTLGDLRLTWYHHMDARKTVEIVNYLKRQVTSGTPIFYNIYTETEKRSDPEKENTGLFFFKGAPGRKFAVCNAGSGFTYVGAMQDSFPHALIYRPGAQTACEDLARAIFFIFDHAEELEIDVSDYSLWGGSAGGRMAAWVASYGTTAFGSEELPRPAAVVMQYTGHSEYSCFDPPTFACVGESDGIASWRLMKRRLEFLRNIGIDTEFHSYPGLQHGFGIGTGTAAEGWINQAVAFWEKQMKRKGSHE